MSPTIFVLVNNEFGDIEHMPWEIESSMIVPYELKVEGSPLAPQR